MENTKRGIRSAVKVSKNCQLRASHKSILSQSRSCFHCSSRLCGSSKQVASLLLCLLALLLWLPAFLWALSPRGGAYMNFKWPDPPNNFLLWHERVLHHHVLNATDPCLPWCKQRKDRVRKATKRLGRGFLNSVCTHYCELYSQTRKLYLQKWSCQHHDCHSQASWGD